MTTDTSSHAALKARQQATWASGDFAAVDFAAVGTMITIAGELLCESVDLRAGQDVLDVATGSGNTALAAARRFTNVTGVDYVPALIERAKVRAQAEGLIAEFLVGDAEDLPVPDASFDVVLSTFGVMFAPDHERAAAEMLRVLRPGGRIGLSNWVPTDSSAPCSGSTPSTSRRLPGCARRCCGVPRSTCARCSPARPSS